MWRSEENPLVVAPICIVDEIIKIRQCTTNTLQGSCNSLYTVVISHSIFGTGISIHAYIWYFAIRHSLISGDEFIQSSKYIIHRIQGLAHM